MSEMNPTKETYDAFQHYYDIFNEKFFNGKLPYCLITYQRGKSYRAYFMPRAFKKGERVTDEIAMNPEAFINDEKKDVLATFLHEICHLWQEHYGKPSRGGYHNKEWAEKMKEVGLMPFGVGKENYGKETGQKLHHEIIEGGVFDQFIQNDSSNHFEMWVQRFVPLDLTQLKERLKVDIQSLLQEKENLNESISDLTIINALDKVKTNIEETFEKADEQVQALAKESGYKIKYSCKCGLSVWGKAKLNILCLDCKSPFIYDLE